MKLLEAINEVTIEDKDMIEEILYTIEERKDTVEMQEPNSDNEFFYEKWEEKFDDIEEIYDDLESLVDELDDYEDEIPEEDKENLTNELNDIISRIKDHQFEYGGLKRLKI